MMLTNEQRDNLYNIAITEVQKIRFSSDFMNILSSIYHVYEQDATGEDSRFSVLGDEISKHYVLNDDWPDDKLFISILKLKDDDETLLRFIQALINTQDGNVSEDTIVQINQNIPEGMAFLKSNDNIFLFVQKGSSSQSDVKQNAKFIKCKCSYSRGGLILDKESIPQDIDNNVFLLAHYNWDDYGNKTSFILYYIDSDGNQVEIGGLKLMKIGESNTYNILDNSFYILSEDYCSLGQDTSYYVKMYELFKGDTYIYLKALRDVAIYSKIHEKFENEDVFRVSLLRENIAEKALREGRFIVNGRRMNDAYAFTYLFKPEYYTDSKAEPVNISFQFQYKCKPYERVYGLIGENGVGKTTLVNNIISSLTENSERDSFVGLRPIFSKVMVISYSPFDAFPTQISGSVIDYLYCGLLENENIILPKEKQYEKLRANIRTINKRNSLKEHFCEIWLNIMKDVFPNSVIQSFYTRTYGLLSLQEDEIYKACILMSSGETIFLYVISDIIANIRQDTLLLFDEPEQHLHPHGIMQLIRAIYTILEKFESYAIIATHSPLVIREMLSKNVFVFNREENYLHVAKIGIESFGEDIAILNDIAFKNRSENKQYEKYISELVEDSDNYNEVVAILQNEHNELGLNTRLLIQSAFEKKEGGLS